MSDVPVIDGELIDAPSQDFRAVPEAFRDNGPSSIQTYAPQPQSGLSGGFQPAPVDGFGNPNPYAYSRDPNIPNYTGVADRDWTPEVDELNRRIADDIAADPGIIDRNQRSRGGNGNLLRRVGDAADLIGAASAGTSLGNQLLRTQGYEPIGQDGIWVNPDTGDAVQVDNGFLGTGLFGGIRPIDIPRSAPGDPPFTGGQSPGVLYDISLSTFSFNSEGVKNSNNHNTQLRGPISVFRLNTGSGSVLNTVRVLGSNGFKDYKRSNAVEVFFENVSISRADGQPDTGGDPQGEPEPVGRPRPGPEPDFSAPAAPTIPGVGFPTPSLPNIPLPNPFGEPIPDGEGFEGIDSPNPLIPDVPSFPGFDPTGQPGTDPSGGGGSGSGSGDPGEGLSCCEKIDQIHGYFQVSGLGAYDAAQCDAGAMPDAWTGTGLTGLYRAVEALTRAVGLIWERLRCLEGGAIAVPEWWAVRPGADVPQLAIAFRSVNSDSKWSLTIPHYNKGPDFKPQIPRYQKGSYFSTLTLTDNTKLVVNAKSHAEGERVINALVPLIDPAYLPASLDIQEGRRRGRALSTAEVVPELAVFYARGQASPIPDFYADIQVI